MTTRAQVEDFLTQRRLALVGVSRSGKGFGHVILKELRGKGYEVLPVHPELDSVGGERCWRSLGELPAAVGGVVVVVPPEQTEKVVRDALSAGIGRVWMQQGAESETAVRFCEDNGMTAVHGECILMFAEPTAFFHRAHRWLWGVLGKLPE